MKIGFIDSVIIAFYYLFVNFILAVSLGFFNRLFVFIVVINLVFLLIIKRKSIIWPKEYWWIFILVPLTVAGSGFLRGFFSGDAYSVWLQAGKEIAQLGYLPYDSWNAFATHYSHLSPFLSLLFASTFIMFDSFNEFLCLWVPLFFSSVTVVLLYIWAKELGLKKKYLFAIPLLFLSNFIVLGVGWQLLQESLILFFGTAFFYYYGKYHREPKLFYLILIIMSFVLAVASKVSGFFLGLLILYLFFKKNGKTDTRK